MNHQNESYDVLTREEKKLLKVLKSKRNVDGHYELLLSNTHISQYKKDPFFVYLDDPEFIDVLNAIYEQGDKKSFRKKIFRLIQQSIQEKMNYGIATYEFIQNVACIVDEKWLKQQIKTASTRKMLTLYFFKKIEKSSGKTLAVKKSLWNEYLAYAKQPKDYVTSTLFSDTNCLDVNSTDLFNAIKNSF